MSVELVSYWKDEFAEVVLRKENGFLRMYINNGLQFDERDEYRYHQTVFLLPALCLNPERENSVLVLGGGDGLGVRELLRLPYIKQIDLVDISPYIVTLAKTHPEMLRLNMGSLNNEKVNVIIGDGYEYVQTANKKYDLIVLDYPDPSIREDDPVNKLFTRKHFEDVKGILNEDGIMSMQATSVVVSPNVFRWLQLQVGKVFETVVPLRVNIGSFGDIGVILAGEKVRLETNIPEGVFFNEDSLNEFAILHEDEKPDISDKELINLPIYQVIGYDLKVRQEEIRDEVDKIYKRQIETGKKNTVAKQGKTLTS